MSIIAIVESMTNHHVDESTKYALDRMFTKSNAHREAILVFIRKGSQAYIEYCIPFRLNWHIGAKNCNYNPKSKEV